MLSFITLLSLFTLTRATPQATSYSNCVGTISSLDDVSTATRCTTININSFTVPAGQTFKLDLLQGTTVNVLGEIGFGIANWQGPLFQVQGEDITFNGNQQIWNGGGPFYWDGCGGGGGVTKPSPMMVIHMSGTLSDVHVVNSPERCFSVDNTGPLTIRHATVDNSQGKYPNDKSNGRPAGRNTDGFDVSGNDVTIMNSNVTNQDDCIAINKGQNIVFKDNHCQGGHGVSIGSIRSNTVVDGVVFQGNTVVDSVQAFRIKTQRTAANSRVSNVTYIDNTATGCTQYGVVITQSYPKDIGSPGNGVAINDISFQPGVTDISVTDSAARVALDCGQDTCAGVWDWSALITSGGKAGPSINSPNLDGYSQ